MVHHLVSASRSSRIGWLVVLFAASCIATFGLVASPASAISTGSITGKVTNSTGTGLPGITVSGISSGGSNAATVTTNAQGIYTLTALPPGTWEVDFADHTHKYAGPAFQTGIQVGDGVTTAPAQKLQLGATLVGTLFTSAKKPLKGANLVLWCAGDGKKSDMLPRDPYWMGANGRSFVTSKTGAFTINGEAAGLCTFETDLAHSTQYYNKKQTLSTSNTFTLSAGKKTSVGRVTLLVASTMKTTFKALGHQKLSVTFKVSAASKIGGTATIDCFNTSTFVERQKKVTLKAGNASTTLVGLSKGNNECWASYSGSATVANYFFDYKTVAVK